MNILCITDDKSGHVSQLRGLAEALARQTTAEIRWQSVQQPSTLEKNYRADLVLSAGNSTHWPALKHKWRYGGKAIALSKPALPKWLFDLCTLPRHDGQPESTRVFNTEGALNPIQPSTESIAEQGLILIGGPSKYYGWDDKQMLQQLQKLVNALPSVQWTLTTSRRTPASFAHTFNNLRELGINVVPVKNTDHPWLLAQFKRCGTIWVTEESVSMVYESLSSGARVGLLSAPRLKHNRISQRLDELVQQSRLSTLNDAAQLLQKPSPQPLQEAQRTAQHILKTLFAKD